MGNDEELFSWYKSNKKIPKTVLCKECSYVQRDINENDEEINSTEDNDPTFLSSHFLEKPVFTVENIEERLNEMNLERVQSKGEKLSSHEYDKDRTVQHKKRKGTSPRIASLAKIFIKIKIYWPKTFYQRRIIFLMSKQRLISK